MIGAAREQPRARGPVAENRSLAAEGAERRRNVDRLLATTIAGRSDALRLRDRALLEVLYGSGIRRSELVGLNLEDVDLERRQMRVVGGKGNKDRTVLLTAAAADAMRALPRAATAHGGPGLLPQPQRHGGSAIRCCTKCFARSSRSAASIHPRRRTRCATRSRRILYENGADLLTIKELLGHESLATTQVYTKVSVQRLREQFDRSHPRQQTTAAPRSKR